LEASETDDNNATTVATRIPDPIAAISICAIN